MPIYQLLREKLHPTTPQFQSWNYQVAEAVTADITQFLESDVEVKLAGHSLGGAVAVIVAAKLKKRGYNVGTVTTFGAPMITDARGAAHLRELVRVMRVTHERDPVPLTPLTRTKLLPPEGRSHEGSVGCDTTVGSLSEDDESVVSSTSEGAGDTRAASADDASGEGGQGARKASRWRIGASSAYSHFGSQARLLCLLAVPRGSCRHVELTLSPVCFVLQFQVLLHFTHGLSAECIAAGR